MICECSGAYNGDAGWTVAGSLKGRQKLRLLNQRWNMPKSKFTYCLTRPAVQREGDIFIILLLLQDTFRAFQFSYYPC